LARGTLTAVLLLASVAVANAEDDVVTYLGGKAGKQIIRRTGKIEDYTGAGLVLVSAQGRKETIPLDKLVDFQTTATEEETAGDKLLREGKLKEAIEAYQKAKQAESRKWVTRRIAAQLVKCFDLSGEIDKAGDQFLSIVAADAETPYFGLIPLAWRTPQNAIVPTKATKWLAASDQPVAALIGASWLLSGAERTKALAALKSLSSDLDPRIAHLASAQLWRTSLVTATAADLQKWQAQVDRMPAAIKAGPLLVLGDLLARMERNDDALLAWLEPPLVFNERPSLAAAGLQSAAKLLEKLGRSDDAERLTREIEAKYPALK
jgi:tetratricopeptide (TPR) repeat protein